MEQTPSRQTDQELDERLFSDPTINQTITEDPLFKFVQQRWRQLLVIAALIFAGYFANRTFQQTYNTSMKRSAELLKNLRAEFTAVQGLRTDLAKAQEERTLKDKDDKASAADKEQAAKKAEAATQALASAETRLKEMMTTLSDSREPYRQIAALYSAADTAQGAAPDWQSLKANDARRFFSELLAFNLAGRDLEQTEKRSQALAALIALAEKGEYLNVAAAVRYAHVAVDQEKEKAAALLKGILERYPEQNSEITPELERLG